MKIATWNVNSIKARLPHLLDWCARATPDVLLLQETKTVDETFPRLELEALGYHCAFFGQKSYNGVAVLSRFPIVETQRGLPGNPEEGEARYLEALLRYSDHKSPLRVASVYVPMGQDTTSDRFPFKLAFLDALTAHARTLLKRGEMFVLGGDYNVAPDEGDVYDPHAFAGKVLFHPDERRRLRSLLYLGLYDAVRMITQETGLYSWWDYRAGGWERGHGLRIDHLLLSPRMADRLTDAGIDTAPRTWERPSDHAPVWCALDLEK